MTDPATPGSTGTPGSPGPSGTPGSPEKPASPASKAFDPGRERSARRLATTMMLVVVGLLAFTAYAKWFYPSTKTINVEGTEWVIAGQTLDRSIAGFEVVVLILAAALHRKWWAWLLNALFFGGLAGYSCFKSWHGESCGCAGELVKFPPYFMFGVDVVIVLISLGVSLALRAPGKAALAALVAAIAAGGAGWVLADRTTPPRRVETAKQYEGKLAHQRLFESQLLEDIRAQPEGGPAWLIFCYDPTCHICEEMKPVIEFKLQELEETADPVLQVRMLSIPEMEKDERVKIEAFAWETPTLFVVQDGAIVKKWAGNELEKFTPERFQEIYDAAASGAYLGANP